jgi:hypothetical protein
VDVALTMHGSLTLKREEGKTGDFCSCLAGGILSDFCYSHANHSMKFAAAGIGKESVAPMHAMGLVQEKRVQWWGLQPINTYRADVPNLVTR